MHVLVVLAARQEGAFWVLSDSDRPRRMVQALGPRQGHPLSTCGLLLKLHIVGCHQSVNRPRAQPLPDPRWEQLMIVPEFLPHCKGQGSTKDPALLLPWTLRGGHIRPLV